MAKTDGASFHGIIGRSPPMLALFRQIERFAAFDVSVLIQGETGTGKELVARAIRARSGRKERRFEPVNAGTLNRELLRSELFGHERGAFTGADVRKPGLLVVADGGTVFLDEIGDLDADAQVILLRFLESGEIRPVGSLDTRHVDVRMIAATHRDLESAIAEQSFREDLYYRLSDVVLDVPPLRERGDDVELLIEHFRLMFNRKYGLSVDPPEPDAVRMLKRAPWPGNVRQLEKVVKRAMILRGEGALRIDDIRLPARRIAARATHGPVTVSLSARSSAALQLAKDHGVVTRRALARQCGTSGEIARQELAALEKIRLLRRVGRGRSTAYVLR